MTANGMQTSRAKFWSQTGLDLTRQVFSLTPILILFIVSREKVYIGVSVLTSSTTLSAALLMLGLNFVVLLKDRKRLIGATLGYAIATIPLLTVLSFAMFDLSDKTDSIALSAIWIFIVGESIFSLPQQLLSKYAMAEWQIKPLIIANILSPCVRAVSMFALAVPALQNASALIYLFSQIAFTLWLLRASKISVNFHFYKFSGFARILKVGIPNWLSGLGVTALDNLAILFIAFTFHPTIAAQLILIIRVFSVASVPIHSVASVKIATGLKSTKTEVFVALVSGVAASALGFIALVLLQAIFGIRGLQLLEGSMLLAFFPFLRSLTTFSGNYFTLVERPWIRVWSGLAGIATMAASFLLLSFNLNHEKPSLVVGSFPIIFSEFVMVSVLGLRILLGKRYSHNTAEAWSHPNSSE